MNKTKQASLLLVLVTIIWGSGFVATEYAINANMSTSLIMSVRFTIAAIIIGFVSIKEIKKIDLITFKYGFFAGFLLFLGFYFQTFGQMNTTVSNSAFLTATNVIMIPFIVWIFTKKRPLLKTFILTGTTFIGILFLTIKPNFSFRLNGGDVYMLVCAFLFALHIVFLSRVSKVVNIKALTFLQLAIASVFSLIMLFVFKERTTFDIGFTGVVSGLYLAIFSTSVCYLLQTYAQKYISASKAGIILCMEGFFGSLFSIFLGLDQFTITIFIGGLFIIGSVILMEA